MKKFILIFICFILTNCNDNDNVIDCSSVSCISLAYYIKVENKETGVNYISENNLTKNDISIKTEEGHSIEFIIVQNSENNEYNNTIAVTISSSKNETISIKGISDIGITYKLTPKKTDNCCDFGNINITNVSTEFLNSFDNDSAILTIYI